MELEAAITALETLKRPMTVAMFTDSNYLRQGITVWLPAWKKRGWRTADNQPVKNQDLWQRLERALARTRSPGAGSGATRQSRQRARRRAGARGDPRGGAGPAA